MFLLGNQGKFLLVNGIKSLSHIAQGDIQASCYLSNFCQGIFIKSGGDKLAGLVLDKFSRLCIGQRNKFTFWCTDSYGIDGQLIRFCLLSRFKPVIT